MTADWRDALVVRDGIGRFWTRNEWMLLYRGDLSEFEGDGPFTVIIDAEGRNVETDTAAWVGAHQYRARAERAEQSADHWRKQAEKAISRATDQETRNENNRLRTELAEERAGRLTWQERAEELDDALTAAQARAEASEKDYWDLRAEKRKEFETIVSLLRPILTACEDAS